MSRPDLHIPTPSDFSVWMEDFGRGSVPERQERGLVSRAFEALKMKPGTPKPGALGLAVAAIAVLSVIGGGAAYVENDKIKVGAEDGLRAAFNFKQLDTLTPPQLLQQLPVRFENAATHTVGQARVLNRENAGCYAIEAQGGDTQGLWGKYETQAKITKKQSIPVPLSHVMTICPK